MTVWENVRWYFCKRKPADCEQCASSSIACGVMMLDRAFGDQRDWERRLSGSWASQLPLELCGQHYTLPPLFLFISLPLSWPPSLNSADSKQFRALALSAVRRTDKASAYQWCSKQSKEICSLRVWFCTLGDADWRIYSEVWGLLKQSGWKLEANVFLLCT